MPLLVFPAIEAVRKFTGVWISIVRPSRRPLRGLLRMRSFLSAIKGLPHAEERPKRARLEARTASLQLVFWRVGQFPDSLEGRDPSCRRSRVLKRCQRLTDPGMFVPRRNGPRPAPG